MCNWKTVYGGDFGGTLSTRRFLLFGFNGLGHRPRITFGDFGD